MIKTDDAYQTIQLQDGRSLAYAEYGDPAGSPLFFFHGSNDSRLEKQFSSLVISGSKFFPLADRLLSPPSRYANFTGKLGRLAAAGVWSVGFFLCHIWHRELVEGARSSTSSNLDELYRCEFFEVLR